MPRCLLLCLMLPFWLVGCTPEPEPPGRAVYVQNCAACHGPRGRGDGPAAKVLETPPADLTRIAARRNGVWPMLEVMSIIDGYNKGTNPRPGMPAFEGFLDEELVPFDTGNGVFVPAPKNLIALVNYLERLQSPPPSRYVP